MYEVLDDSVWDMELCNPLCYRSPTSCYPRICPNTQRSFLNDDQIFKRNDYLKVKICSMHTSRLTISKGTLLSFVLPLASVL